MLGSFTHLRTTTAHLAYWHRGAISRDRIVIATDQATDVFTLAGQHAATAPADPRKLPTLTTLPDGRILAVGGYVADRNVVSVLASCRLFDVDTLAWSDAPPLATPRLGHATVLLDGSVLVIGGRSIDAVDAPGLPNVEAWTPGEVRWRTLPALPIASAHPAATILADRSLIVVDQRAWRWDGAAWSELPNAPMRSRVALAPLARGGALAIGGQASGGDVADVDGFLDGAWSPVAPMLESRAGAAAIELADGTVVVIGGGGTRFRGPNTDLLYEWESDYRNPEPPSNRWTECEDVEVRSPDGTWTQRFGIKVSHPELVRIDATRVLLTGGCAPGIWVP